MPKHNLLDGRQNWQKFSKVIVRVDFLCKVTLFYIEL